jgi:hypothetical protein
MLDSKRHGYFGTFDDLKICAIHEYVKRQNQREYINGRARRVRQEIKK